MATPVDTTTGAPLSLHQRRCLLMSRARTLVAEGEIAGLIRTHGTPANPKAAGYAIKINSDSPWRYLTLKAAEHHLTEIWNGRA